MKLYELLIIGGGASGLAAAVTAHTMGIRNIAVLERLSRVGKKILATGNGRCNLSHVPVTSADYLGSYNPGHVLDVFGNVQDFFENLGLYCRMDDQGRMYPYSMTASAVLDALRMYAGEISEFCNQRVTRLEYKHALWHAFTEQGEVFQAKKIIFSAGGTVGSQFGTDGTAWRMLADLGIPLVEGRAILCPIRSDSGILKALKGIRVKGAVTLLEHGQNLQTETGEIQFTEQAVSGICIFNLACRLDSRRFADYQLKINLCPELDFAGILDRLYTCQAVRPESDCETMLSGLLRKALARVILKSNRIRPEMPCMNLTDKQLHDLACYLQDFRFPVLGTVHAQAQASTGGVHGSALDENLQVKSHPGLYITGEAVDIYAPCGGYQLHWAWASGSTAAKACAKN